jgi:hypothetical protein
MWLYLDDVRRTPDGWERVYSAQECIDKLSTRRVEIVSLDHDLGDGVPSGYDVMKWIEKQVFTDPTYTPPSIIFHTDNPAGKENMRLCLNAIHRELNRREEVPK